MLRIWKNEVKIPSRTTARTYVTTIYNSEKLRVKEMLQVCSVYLFYFYNWKITLVTI